MQGPYEEIFVLTFKAERRTVSPCTDCLSANHIARVFLCFSQYTVMEDITKTGGNTPNIDKLVTQKYVQDTYLTYFSLKYKI